MKVSIVTVSYNSQATIADTVNSVAQQCHPDIEHLVIDGASTDKTLEVIRNCAVQPSTLVSEPDQGIYDAMNKGMERARGDLIGFLNADDMLADERAVSRMVESIESTDSDIVYGDLVYVDQIETNKVVRYWRSGNFSHGALRRGWMPPHPTFYVTRSILEKIGTFDTRLKIAADYDFMLRALVQPAVAVAYVPHVQVRMRQGGVSNASPAGIWTKSKEDLSVVRRHQVGGWSTLLAKNLRKLPQFFRNPRP